MAIRRQDLAVLSLYCMGYSKLRTLAIRARRETVAIFVTFHDIPPSALKYFEANLAFLKRETNVVSLADFVDGRLSPDRINVVVTFDDGYKSWSTYAVPILKRLGLPAIFFISSGFVDLSSDAAEEFMRSNLRLIRDPTGNRAGLTSKAVRALVDEGFAVGGHTVNHFNLGQLRDRAQLGYEIAEDKMRLERMTGTKIDYFSYPFGAYRHPEVSLAGLLTEAGYRGAVTTMSGFNRAATNRLLLHRELTPAMMLPMAFRARAYGNYDAVRFVKRQLDRVRPKSSP